MRSDYGRVKLAAGDLSSDPVKQQGLKLMEDYRFYALSKKLPVEVDTVNRNYVISYAIKNEKKQTCSGSYLKFYSELDAETLTPDSPYVFMFGTDVCGHTDRLHMIRNYRGHNVDWSHTDSPEDGPLTHYYTVFFRTDNTYALYVDGKFRWNQSIENDWPLLQPRTLEDPTDVKPKGWVDVATMPDPSASKPDDWDESQPKEIDDMTAEKPDTWENERDGEWQRPKVANPKYRGKWQRPHIRNPDYKGPYIPRRIPNHDYIPDENLYQLSAPIRYVGVEVWQVESGSIYDDIMIGDDVDEVLQYVRNAVATNVVKEKENEERRLAAIKKEEDARRADVEAIKKVEEALAEEDGADL